MNATLDASQALALRRLLETGLPLEARPYQALARQIGAEERQVLAQVGQWQHQGLFRRLGLAAQCAAHLYRQPLHRSWQGGAGNPR